MSQKMHRDLKQALQPYMFVLKEGQQFDKNCLDYTLLMLHMNCLEVIQSPSAEYVAALTSSHDKAFIPAKPPENGEKQALPSPVSN